MSFDDLTAHERALIDEFRGALGDPRTWDQPSTDGEAALVAAIDAERRLLSGTRPRRRWTAMAAIAVAGAAAGVAATVYVMRDRTPEPEATAAMQGTDFAPGLQGDAEFTTKSSGVEIEIHLAGLPRRDGGEYYQLWVHNCSGSAWVPAGTFHDMDYVVAWAGVAPSDYPVLTVTEEAASPADGDGQRSLGRVVAWGSLAECTT
ncbi:MAG: anti-sigma factor [Actinobacteria bacterium]|nr:anti-sigma factor [Actinomycetota bacterium]